MTTAASRWATVGLAVLATCLALLWIPFRFVAVVGRFVYFGAHGLGDLLVRPLYWDVIQARRRLLGLPMWQAKDRKIGIEPPCMECGMNFPPGKHKKDCALDKLLRIAKELE